MKIETNFVKLEEITMPEKRDGLGHDDQNSPDSV